MHKKIFLMLTIVLFVLAIPSIGAKIKMEQTADTVEFSADYYALLSLSQQHASPAKELKQMLLSLKKEGVTTITLPNNSLNTLQERNLVAVYTGSELTQQILFETTKQSFSPSHTFVHVNKTHQKEIASLLTSRFSDEFVKKRVIQGVSFYEFAQPKNQLVRASLPFLSSDVDFLTSKPYAFSLMLKIDNEWNGKEDLVKQQIQTWKPFLSKLYFADSGAPGFPDSDEQFVNTLPNIPLAYKEYFTADEKQKGINSLALNHHYNVVRLHAISDTMFTNKDQQVLHERMIKAATERNIRLFHLQFPTSSPTNDSQNDVFSMSLQQLHSVKQVLEAKGFSIGISHSFESLDSYWVTLSRYAAFLCGVALMSYVCSLYTKKGAIGFSIVGLLAFLLSFSSLGTWAWKGFALLIAICIPVLVVHYILYAMKSKTTFSYLSTIRIFLTASLLSLLGGLLVAGMHADIKYLLYLDQFRGVSFAHLLPIAIAVLLIAGQLNLFKKAMMKKILIEPIRMYHLLILAIVGVIGLYYLSRTGNEGVMLPFESQFRSFLEQTLGIRPRTKEFLVAHPLLLFTLYYWHRHKWVKWALPVATIGQLSMVNTFTHFHTPVLVSLTRGIYGIGFGLLIGVCAIFIVEWVLRFIRTKKTKS